uniref:Uncharacterized protein n=1 Tax=Rhizophora mucronata TaxID=61149 RepID=A0A2P2M9Z6_RHIMU
MHTSSQIKHPELALTNYLYQAELLQCPTPTSDRTGRWTMNSRCYYPRRYPATPHSYAAHYVFPWLARQAAIILDCG